MRRLLFIPLALFFFASCSSNAKKELVGTWRISEIETSTKLPDSVKNAMLMNAQMQFTEDGKYSSSGGVGVDQGTYTVDEEGKNLSTISQAGRNNEVYTIEKLNDKKLVLKTHGTTVTMEAAGLQ